LSYDGNKVIEFSEYLTKWPEAFALPDAKVKLLARVFVGTIVCRHGAPKILLLTEATNFLLN